ncbi:exosortase A [Pelagibius sp.]|uniref:exosortase A n=1 Tax=Pelagibius sp. TaxID=1931238 RepID=UPI00263117AB|nr:exosortase A [Pelagibius sp.]
MTVVAEKVPEGGISDEPMRAWRRAGLLFALATLLLFGLYFETLASMVRVWTTSDTFGYGFLVLPVVVYLAYQRRHHLAQLTPRPCFWALVWVAGAIVLHLVGSIGNVLLFQQLALVGLWQGLFALFMGWAVVRQMIFPLFFLIFAVPMGAEIVPLLQRITADITVFLLRASGMPTFLSGVLIEIPSGSFVVADVCSGVRFLITALVLGTLAIHLFFRSWLRRAAFLLLCLVVPILANGLRAYGIIMLAHWSDYRVAISVDHLVYGLIFLTLVLMILVGLGALFRDHWPGEEPVPAAVASATGVRLSSSVAAFALAVLLLGGGKVWTHGVTAPPDNAGPIELAALHPGGEWVLDGGTHADWQPHFRGADSQFLRSFNAPDGEVVLFVAHYAYQRDGHEIIAGGNSFVGRGTGRQVTRFEQTEVALADRRWAVREILVQTVQGPRLIWFWYEVGGTQTASAVVGKLLEIWHTISGGSRSATAFALSTAPADDLRASRARLTAFLSALEETQSLTTATLIRPEALEGTASSRN